MTTTLKTLLLLGVIGAAMGAAAACHADVIGTYEVSNMYNCMPGGGPSGPRNPGGVQSYHGVATAPIQVDLAPGTYSATIIPGRETGNPGDGGSWVTNYWYLVTLNNPSAVFPETGYDGGTADPGHKPYEWVYSVNMWIGTSTDASSGQLYSVDGLGNPLAFDIRTGESLWLYWWDYWIGDNMGGVTVQLDSRPVPEPAAGVCLLGLAGAGLLLRIRSRRR